MKLDARLLDEEVLVGRVVATVHDVGRLPLSRIALESRLREDLNLGLSDGHALMASLHAQFEMDWTGLDLEDHFGDRAARPLTVAQLAEALRQGRWPADRPPTSFAAVLALGAAATVALAPLLAVTFGG